MNQEEVVNKLQSLKHITLFWTKYMFAVMCMSIIMSMIIMLFSWITSFFGIPKVIAVLSFSIVFMVSLAWSILKNVELGIKEYLDLITKQLNSIIKIESFIYGTLSDSLKGEIETIKTDGVVH